MYPPACRALARRAENTRSTCKVQFGRVPGRASIISEKMRKNCKEQRRLGKDYIRKLMILLFPRIEVII